MDQFAFQPNFFLRMGQFLNPDRSSERSSNKIAPLKSPQLFENFRITDSRMAKYIYAIKTNGEIKVARGQLRRDETLRSRPTHSQVSEGKTVYAAGEVFLGTHDETFASFSAWLHWLEKNSNLVRGDHYKAIEINNLSGHYLPGHECLKYARLSIIKVLEELGFDVSDVRLINRLLTGVKFSPVSVYGFQANN